MPTRAPLLDAWLHPLSVAELREQYWTSRPYRAEPDPARIEKTLAALPGRDLPAWLGHAREPIEAWFIESDRVQSSLRLDRDQALLAHRAGLTLYGQFLPSVAEPITDELSRALGRSPHSIRVSFFASRSGAYTPPHVDGNDNLTVQLSGRKRWRIAAGAPWLQGNPGIARDRADNPLLHDLFRTSRWAPELSEPQEHEMAPGAMLYCPASYWHSVQALNDSLSLNISLDTRQTWAHVLLPALRSVLLERPAWRRPAEGLWSQGELREAALQTVRDLLGSLSDEIASVHAADFIAAWNEPKELEDPDDPDDPDDPELPATIVRNRLMRCEIVHVEVGESFRVVVTSAVRTSLEHRLTLGWDYLQPFLTMIGAPGAQATEDFHEVSELVAELLSLGVLREHRPG